MLTRAFDTLLSLDAGSLLILIAFSSLTLGLTTLLLWGLGTLRLGPSGVDKSVGLKREEKGSSSGNLTAAGGDDRVLNPLQFKQFRVQSSERISHNTKLIRVGIPDDRTLGLPIGRHISVRAEIDGNQVIRAYTPTSRTDTKGYFELLIKSYEMGKLSPHLHSLKKGSTIDVRGPVGRFKYAKNQYPVMGFIAGGTGLTPCLQVIRCILEGPEGQDDTTKFVLLFQNRTEADILLRADLEALQKAYPDRLQILFFLSNCSDATWGNSGVKVGDTSLARKGAVQHVRGYIDAAAVKALIARSLCPFVGLCGPAGFNDSMKQLLEKEEHEAEKSIYVF